MSQFTSKKVKINDSQHFSTLLTEYSGDYEVKIWILEEDAAWTAVRTRKLYDEASGNFKGNCSWCRIPHPAQLSSMEAQAFTTHYRLTKEIFLDELQKALTLCDPEVLYSIEKKESMGHIFCWKRQLDTGISVKNGEMTVVEVTLKEAYDEVFDRCFENNQMAQSQINILKREMDSLLTEKTAVLSSYEKAVEQKRTFEQTLYSQFLAILNTKKEKIRELQEEVDKLAQCKESSANVPKKAADTKGRDNKEQSLMKEAGDRREKKKSSMAQTESEDVKGQKVKDDEDPFDVDTDLDDTDSDNACGASSIPMKSKRVKKSQLHSQSSSELFGSLEEVSSPVAILPKRLRLNPKETVKSSITESVLNKATSEDMDDDNLLDLL